MTANLAAEARRILNDLRSHDIWPRTRLLERQQLVLRDVVRHAAESSPYYREALPARARTGNVDLRPSRNPR